MINRRIEIIKTVQAYCIAGREINSGVHKQTHEHAEEVMVNL